MQTEVADSSVGSETTFAVDSADSTFLTRQLLALTERTARRARQAGVRGRTVSIKVRFEDFSTLTRSATLSSPTDMSRTVYATARELLAKVLASAAGGQRIRLLGVRLEGLVAAEQVSSNSNSGHRTPVRAGGRRREPSIERSRGSEWPRYVRPRCWIDRKGCDLVPEGTHLG